MKLKEKPQEENQVHDGSHRVAIMSHRRNNVRGK
jgi:hypothetical protein